MSRIFAVAVLLLCALAGGCAGSGDEESASSSDREAPTSAPEVPAPSSPTGRADAARALKTAQRDLVSSGSGEFTVRASLNGAPLMTDEGGYDLARHSFEVTRLMYAPDDVIASYLRAVDKVTYLQMLDWKEPFAGCWLRQDEAALPRPAGLEASLSAGPPAVVAALVAEAEGYDETGVIRVVVPAATALQMLGIAGSHLEDFGRAIRGDAPATIMLERGRVRWMRVVGSEVAARFASAGITIDPELIEALEKMKVRLDLSVGRPVTVEVPSADLIMRSSGDRMTGCPRTTG